MRRGTCCHVFCPQRSACSRHRLGRKPYTLCREGYQSLRARQSGLCSSRGLLLFRSHFRHFSRRSLYYGNIRACERRQKSFNKFFRVLKPGGTLALYEYWHVSDQEIPSDVSKHILESAKRVNKYEAMPTGELLTKGVLRNWLKEQGFVDIEETDLSENIAPISFFFYLLGYILFLIISFFRLQQYFVNIEARVQGYRGLKRGLWGYVSYKAKKPLGDTNNNDTGLRRR